MPKFKKGRSGNPGGRPKGIKDRRILFAEIIDSHKEELLNKSVEMALSGNEQMLRLLLSRILPIKPKDDVINIKLTGNTPTENSKQIIEALNKKSITPNEAMILMQALVMQTKVFEVDEGVKIIEEIKAALKF